VFVLLGVDKILATIGEGGRGGSRLSLFGPGAMGGDGLLTPSLDGTLHGRFLKISEDDREFLICIKIHFER
jgi:hypothetical protein